MHTQSLKSLRAGLDSKAYSSVELTQHFLNRIHQHQSLNAFISIDEEQALLQAQKADEAIKKGNIKTLTGIPLAHKDIFCTTTLPTTCGSKMLAEFNSPYAATIVEKIAAQHSVLIGKTNMDEFAMGSANEHSYFGAVGNPWNPECVPGGSSGGSAAAVAASLVPFATGSDTGGSIRQPAAFCGISGLKPTYGLISRFGMVAYASSFDQAGPMAKSSQDLAFILEAMAGHDPRDSTSIHLPKEAYLYSHQLDKPMLPLRIGLPRCFFQPGIDLPIQQAIHETVNFFKKAGAEIIDIDFDLYPYWVPCYYLLACAEASSNLARYDGVRYGHRSDSAKNIKELVTRSRDEGFGLEVKRRILTGTYVLTSGYFDAYFVQAQKVRRMIQSEILQAFTNVDVILGPTTPTCAFKIGELITDPTQRYLGDTFTVAANLAGIPALSIPIGFDPAGLPIGLQLMGPYFSEAKLLNMAHFFQNQTSWHQSQPQASL